MSSMSHWYGELHLYVEHSQTPGIHPWTTGNSSTVFAFFLFLAGPWCAKVGPTGTIILFALPYAEGFAINIILVDGV